MLKNGVLIVLLTGFMAISASAQSNISLQGAAALSSISGGVRIGGERSALEFGVFADPMGLYQITLTRMHFLTEGIYANLPVGFGKTGRLPWINISMALGDYYRSSPDSLTWQPTMALSMDWRLRQRKKGSWLIHVGASGSEMIQPDFAMTHVNFPADGFFVWDFRIVSERVTSLHLKPTCQSSIMAVASLSGKAASMVSMWRFGFERRHYHYINIADNPFMSYWSWQYGAAFEYNTTAIPGTGNEREIASEKTYISILIGMDIGLQASTHRQILPSTLMEY